MRQAKAKASRLGERGWWAGELQAGGRVLRAAAFLVWKWSKVFGFFELDAGGGRFCFLCRGGRGE